MIVDLVANFIRILAVDSVEFFISLSKVFQLAPMHLLLVIVLLHLLVARVTVEDHALWVANVAGLASLLAEQGARGLSEVASHHHVVSVGILNFLNILQLLLLGGLLGNLLLRGLRVLTRSLQLGRHASHTGLQCLQG